MNHAHHGLRGSETEMRSSAILGIITLIPLMEGTFLEGTGNKLGMGETCMTEINNVFQLIIFPLKTHQEVSLI